MTEPVALGGEDGPRTRRLVRDYARMYGADERTIKRWKADGVDKSDPLPLDDPEAMMAWWTRNKKLRVPPGIAAAVVEWRKAHRPASAPETPPDELPLTPAVKVEQAVERQKAIDQPVAAEEIGLEQTLRRLVETEVKLSRVATDPGQTKAWLDTIARIGPAARAIREEHERLGKLIPRDRAETLIHEFHAPVEREIRLLARTMCEILGLPQTPHIEDAWNRECDRLFARFQEEVFRK